MTPEPNIAHIASLISDPTRAVILSALLSGEALPASEFAYRAQVTPQTISSHLAKLLDGDLIAVTSIGRHRYYSLRDEHVARTLETLATIAPFPTGRAPKPRAINDDLRQARTCYDHLAGRLGVAVTNALLDKAYITRDDELYALTDAGAAWLQHWGIDVDSLFHTRRKFAYACLDWSERHFHVAGVLGASIAHLFFQQEWVARVPHTRALKITKRGQRCLHEELNIDFTNELVGTPQ